MAFIYCLIRSNPVLGSFKGRLLEYSHLGLKLIIIFMHNYYKIITITKKVKEVHPSSPKSKVMSSDILFVRPTQNNFSYNDSKNIKTFI